MTMVIKIPQTKQEAFAQLDALLGEEDKRELAKGDARDHRGSPGRFFDPLKMADG